MSIEETFSVVDPKAALLAMAQAAEEDAPVPVSPAGDPKATALLGLAEDTPDPTDKDYQPVPDAPPRESFRQFVSRVFKEGMKGDKVALPVKSREDTMLIRPGRSVKDKDPSTEIAAAEMAAEALERGDAISFAGIPKGIGVEDIPDRHPIMYRDPRLFSPARPAAYPPGEEEMAAAVLIWRFLLNRAGGGGVYITAPQLGVPIRMLGVVVADGEVLTLANPEILSHTGETLHVGEWCWSLKWFRRWKDLRVNIKRDSALEVRGWDMAAGAQTSGWLWGSPAFWFQHAMDHLDGRLILDHLTKTEAAVWTGHLRRVDKDRVKRSLR